MKKYRVVVREFWLQGYEIEAETEEKAINAVVYNGYGRLIDNDCKYESTTKEVSWIEEIENTSHVVSLNKEKMETQEPAKDSETNTRYVYVVSKLIELQTNWWSMEKAFFSMEEARAYIRKQSNPVNYIWEEVELEV